MIIMIIKLRVKENKNFEVIQTIQDMNKSSANNVNSIRYDIYCGLEDKNSFILIGSGKNASRLNQYIASHKFSVLLGTKALLCEPMDIQIFTVSHSEGMDAVHSLRESKSRQTTLDKDN